MTNDTSEPPELPPRPSTMMAVANADSDGAVVNRSRRATLQKRQEPLPPPPLPPRESTALTVALSSEKKDPIKEAEGLDCWVNCTRFEANKLLLSGDRQGGTYLLRPCHSRHERFAISVLREENSSTSVDNSGSRRSAVAKFVFRLSRRVRRRASLSENKLKQRESVRVKHYLVRESSSGYYLYSSRRFNDVVELIAYYATKPAKRHRSDSALLRRSIAVEEPDVDGETDSSAFARDSQGRRVRLLRKVGEGSYEMFLAEVDGSHVVSLVLDAADTENATGEVRPVSSKINKTNSKLMAQQPLKMLPLECDRNSDGGTNRRSGRSFIQSGALLLQEAIGRAASRLVATQRQDKDADVKV